MKFPLVVCCLYVLQAQLGAVESEYIWWEAEAAVEHSFPASNAFAPQGAEQCDVLSGAAWLHTDKGAGATASWRVSVTEAGPFHFWTRCFWKHGPFRWRWNGGEWTECGKERVLADSVSIRTHLCANWSPLGMVDLPAGENLLEIEMLSEAKAVAFDCWLLSRDEFTPRGRLKPGERYNRAPEGWFPFEPGQRGEGKVLLDVGRLFNDEKAGARGRVVARGGDLVFAQSGEKVRFWSVVAGAGLCTMEHAAIDALADRLSRHGVNMVRFHIPGAQERRPGRVTAGLHYAVNALKQRGIYSYLLWYCTACNGEHTNLHYFDPEQDAVYREWARCMLGTINPHTGISLAQDPAVVAVELLDEDSLFFWTFRPDNDRLAPKIDILEERFAAWLKLRYGSLAKAREAWGNGQMPPGDDPRSDRVVLYDAGHLTGFDWAVQQRCQQRASDQARFMSEVMRDWYGGTARWLREELGYGGLVVGSNWKTADERVLGPLDQYANLAVDITARNTYFSGGVTGDGRGYSIRTGQRYRELSLLREPEQAILMHIQLADHPHMMTEGSWSMPNRFRSEEPFMIAAYYSLQGVDAYCAFALERDWLGTHAKWPIQVPAALGQYPAAAIAYRRGYISEGPVAVDEALPLEQLYALEGATTSQPLGLDEFQAVHLPAGQSGEVASLPGLDPLAFYVGRVQRRIAEKPGPSRFLNTSDLIDRDGKQVRSATGELTLDWGTGLARIDAAKAQGVCGFLAAAGPVDLADMRVESNNEYGTVMLVSLDGKPLATSASMLLQVMTEERNFGWQTKTVRDRLSKNGPEMDLQEIVDIGEPPICVREIDATVSLKRADAAKLTVIALDAHGIARETLARGVERIALLPDCMHYLIER